MRFQYDGAGAPEINGDAGCVPPDRGRLWILGKRGIF